MAVHSTSKLNLTLCLSSILLLLSFSHAQAESHSLKYCEKGANYAVQISNVEILPNPVVRGEPFTFKIKAYTGEPILSGDLIYEISFAGIEGQPAIFHHALSEETPLPVAPGHFLLTHTELLPPVTPPGTYNVKLTFKDQNDKQLTCVVFPFTIGAKSSVSAI
ncbi:putative immunoglobulin E-set [Medicago truncatula]|uniref:MD-like lipid recognition domain protein/ML domain protein n=1 Tax=Medicago truncatula TaxID=3880 RepID=G7K7K9_MEDTR|nr:phosphatidylglycerol/phosphatidylinositol transfer protein [Medicago truncatula]AES99893.1 MD-like lipid recognition domain protein/ML domain protein [Medicago truncatula]AFK35731.1 unknown [Medicago truncatula]RHN57353.1 putative immunoglobulin E-set [Medicago truncatula]